MGTQSLRLKVGSIYTKGPGKIYYFRYQVEGHRKTVSLQTTSRAEALKKAQTFQPVIQSSSMDVIAAHVSYARGLQDARRDMLLADVWNYYERRPDRATPATVSTWNQYEANLREFVEFINNPLATVREITAQRADEFAQYLRTKGISVHCHNRKIKHLRRIFATLGDFRSGENPFSAPVLFRKQREEQGMGVRRQAFSREQEQKLLCVLADPHFQVLHKQEIRVIYHLGMFTGQRLKDCVLLQWQSIDLERRKIWVKQFKTGKEVTIPIANDLFAVLKEAESWKTDGYVCPKMAARYNKVDKNGKNIGNNLVNLDVLRVVRWIGVEPSVAVPGRKRRVTQYGFHSLRHTFASHCAEAGVPKAVLLSILGTDSEIADKYYTHIGEEAQLKAIEAISGNVTVSAQDKIRHALFYLAGLPFTPERQTLENILKGA